MVEIARELESEVEPADVMEVLQSLDRTLTDEECFSRMSKESGFLRWNLLLVTTKDLEYYLNLVDKAVVGYERVDSSFERRSAVGKMPSNSISCYRTIIH